MKRIISTAVCAICVVVLAQASRAADLAQREKEAQLRQEVKEVERLRLRALLGADVEALDKVWAEDFLTITYRGAFLNKRQRMNAFKAGIVRYESLKNTEVEIRIYGEDTAIVTGLANRKGVENNKTVDGVFRFTRVWVRQEGRWQLAHQQFCKVVR